MDMFDIVIAVGPRDKDILEKQLSYTRKNIIGYRKIFLVCADPNIQMEGCITIDEKSYPFTIDTVDKLHGKTDSNGWYLQQLLKLYAGTVIPGILKRYLVIDCDTFFLRPVRFIEGGKCLYMHGSEYHKPYFDHITANFRYKIQSMHEKAVLVIGLKVHNHIIILLKFHK